MSLSGGNRRRRPVRELCQLVLGRRRLRQPIFDGLKFSDLLMGVNFDVSDVNTLNES